MLYANYVREKMRNLKPHIPPKPATALYWYGDECIENSGGWVFARAYNKSESTTSRDYLIKHDSYMEYYANPSTGGGKYVVGTRNRFYKTGVFAGCTNFKILCKQTTPNRNALIYSRNSWYPYIDETGTVTDLYQIGRVETGVIPVGNDYIVVSVPINDDSSLVFQMIWASKPNGTIFIKAVWAE